jgi:hypothetical protein
MIKAQFIRFIAVKGFDEDAFASIAELELIIE